VTDPLSDAVDVLLGMAYEHRLRILVVLMDGDATPTMLAGSLELDATLVAHHLRQLLVARLVRRRRDGRQVFYGIEGDRTRRLIADVLRYAGLPYADGTPASVARSTVEG
jgi:DNA-binding transcriptional ArsR family regulator